VDSSTALQLWRSRRRLRCDPASGPRAARAAPGQWRRGPGLNGSGSPGRRGSGGQLDGLAALAVHVSPLRPASYPGRRVRRLDNSASGPGLDGSGGPGAVSVVIRQLSRAARSRWLRQPKAARPRSRRPCSSGGPRLAVAARQLSRAARSLWLRLSQGGSPGQPGPGGQLDGLAALAVPGAVSVVIRPAVHVSTLRPASYPRAARPKLPGQRSRSRRCSPASYPRAARSR